MTAPALQLAHVGKAYNAVPAIRELSLQVLPGEILTVLGPSGCGKTTLLRLIAGFEQPDVGTITVGGQVVARPGQSVAPEDRRVGMVFQNYALFPHLSVAENVAFGLPRRQAADRVDAVLALVGLAGYGTRMPHELSGGQQQRVAIARALAPAPAVLLLDEPFSNLDTGRRAAMREDIREILKRSGATAVFVTHSQDEAMFMGDRMAVLHYGELLQIDTPEAVYQTPATRFVAEFIGETDFVPGVVRHGQINTPLGLLTPTTTLPPDAAVDVVLHPDDVRIAPDASGTATITARHFRGMLSVHHVRLADGTAVRSLTDHTLRLKPGTPVRVWADPGHPVVAFVRPEQPDAG